MVCLCECMAGSCIKCIAVVQQVGSQGQIAQMMNCRGSNTRSQRAAEVSTPPCAHLKRVGGAAGGWPGAGCVGTPHVGPVLETFLCKKGETDSCEARGAAVQESAGGQPTLWQLQRSPKHEAVVL